MWHFCQLCHDVPFYCKSYSSFSPLTVYYDIPLPVEMDKARFWSSSNNKLQLQILLHIQAMQRDQLRVYIYHRSKSVSLYQLHPASHAVEQHIRRAYYATYQTVTLLHPHQTTLQSLIRLCNARVHLVKCTVKIAHFFFKNY